MNVGLGFINHPISVRRSSTSRPRARPVCALKPATPPPPALKAESGSAWRKSATIAAAIIASVLFPGRGTHREHKAPDSESAQSQEFCVSNNLRYNVSAGTALRVHAAPAGDAAVLSSPDESFAGKIQVFRDKAEEVKNSLKNALSSDSDDSHSSHQAAVNDALVVLLTTVIIVPLMRRLKTSPILGFLAAGIVLGPNGLGLVRDVATSTALAELGVVFFLFEMGLELSTSKLRSMATDVFGLGTSQFLITGVLLSLAASLAGIPTTTSIIIGAGLALSSSAFVLQLLMERGDLGTRYGRAGFGILLFQDLAVVPCLVLTPLLANSGGASAVWTAVSVASGKAAIALALIWFMGKNFLQPVFRFVARAKSQEAFIAVILFTVLGTASLTQVLGLSDTLGAFLAGVMLAETKYRHQVEADIKPFRGLLLGLFFITVGFSIDLNLAMANIGTVMSLVTGLLAVKTAVITAAASFIGLSIGSALRTGLLLSQGGEFAFVIFGLAQSVGVLPVDLAKLLLLVVAISMALTPLLAEGGKRIASKLESKRGLIGTRMEDADTADARDFVMVAGYGRVGQSVCELLDAKLVRYIAFDMSPGRVIEARKSGLPVYFGDACRPEVLRTAGIERARAVVITLDDPKGALLAVQNIKREFPNIQVYCRARDAKNQKLLQAAGAKAIVPELLETSLQLGGEVLLDYDIPEAEVASLIEKVRSEWMADNGNSIQLRTRFGSLAAAGLETSENGVDQSPSDEEAESSEPTKESDGIPKKTEVSSRAQDDDPEDIYATSTPAVGIDSEESSSPSAPSPTGKSKDV